MTEKKEIWKLIELLNEYEYSLFEDKSLAPQRWDIQDWIVFEKDFCEDLDKPRDLTMDVTHLISHRFWFIEWLVKNDKIDRDKVENKTNFEFTCNYLYKKDEIEYKLLMLLSISNSPIEDLILYLK